MRFWPLDGPNRNLLGLREPAISGHMDYAGLVAYVRAACAENGVQPTFDQSNHEGELVDAIQEAYGVFDGIVIIPAAYNKTAIAIRDALKAVNIPAAEVHLSDISKRESFRQTSDAGMACALHFVGQGAEGYKNAVVELKKYIQERADTP